MKRNLIILFTVTVFVFNNLSAISKKSINLKIEKLFSVGVDDFDNDNYLFGIITDIKLDKFGNIYILDAKHYRIQKFSKNGDLFTISKKGPGPGEFLDPMMIDIDNNCNIYASDLTKRGINIYDSKGKFVKFIKLNITPGDFVISKRHGIFLTAFMNFNKYRIYNIDKNGKVINRFCNSKRSTDKVARSGNIGTITIDDNENIYYSFAYPYEIHKYSPKGKLIKIFAENFEKYQEPRLNKYNLIEIPSMSMGIKKLPNGDVINLIKLKYKKKINYYFDIFSNIGKFKKRLSVKDFGLKLVRFFAVDKDYNFIIEQPNPFPIFLKYKTNLKSNF